MTMGPIFLARHGQTVFNVERRLLGRQDAPLTETGWGQARALARTARALGVRRVMTSPLVRARTTAELAAAAADCPLVVSDALVETDFGRCGGVPEADLDRLFPGVAEAHRADRWNHAWPGGESLEQAAARVCTAIDDIAAEPLTLVVGHQAINRVIVHLLTAKSVSEVLAMSQGSDTLVRVADGVVSFGSLRSDRGAIVWTDGLCGADGPRLV